MIDLLSKLFSLLALIAVSSLVVWGVHGGYMVSGGNQYLEKLPLALKKLLFDCPVCQPTLYVPIVFLISGITVDVLPPQYIVIVWLGTAGLNFVIKEYLYPEQE